MSEACVPWRPLRAALLLPALALACRSTPPGPPAAPMAPVQAAPAPRCPIAPVALVMRAPDTAPRRILTLDANGRLAITWLPGQPALSAQLDPRGCLVGPDGLWAELTPGDRLWTAHEALDVAGDCLRLASGAALCIRPDGAVERRDAAGKAETNAYGSMSIEGYGAGARCASLLLLGTFLSMMPSMAVVDGHPRWEPAPGGSQCTDFPRPGPRG